MRTILLITVLLFALFILNGLGHAFQDQFDDQMVVCYEGGCETLTFYPEDGGGVVGIAPNWLLLVNSDRSAILRNGQPYWHGRVIIEDRVIFYPEVDL